MYWIRFAEVGMWAKYQGRLCVVNYPTPKQPNAQWFTHTGIYFRILALIWCNRLVLYCMYELEIDKIRVRYFKWLLKSITCQLDFDLFSFHKFRQQYMICTKQCTASTLVEHILYGIIYKTPDLELLQSCAKPSMWFTWAHDDAMVWYGYIFYITGPLQGESPGHSWTPLAKGQWHTLWCSFNCQLDQIVKQSVQLLVSSAAIALVKPNCQATQQIWRWYDTRKGSQTIWLYFIFLMISSRTIYDTWR